jgi:prevent-host-death family protein
MEAPMATVNIFQAKTQISKLVDMAERGEDVIIARNGKPAARLTQLKPEKKPVVFGLMKGEIWVADDFDDPLPDDLLSEFEGDVFPPESSAPASQEAAEKPGKSHPA